MSSAVRVARNTFYLYAKMAITVSISLLTTRLVLNALGVSDFGIYAVVGGAISMLGFLHSAMSGATQRFMSFYEGRGDTEKQISVFTISTILHLFIALVLGVILLAAGVLFFHGILNIPADRLHAAKVVYGCCICSTMFTVLGVPYEAVLNAHENMLYYSIVGVFESLLKLLVALTVIRYGGDKLILYGILMALIPLVTRFVMQLYCRRKYAECRIVPRTCRDGNLMREMTSFAGWNLVGSFSSIVANHGGGLIINHFFGNVLNAALGIAAQLNGQLLAFSTNLIKAVTPAIVKKEGASDREAMLKFTITGCKLSFYLFAFLAIPAIVEAPTILRVWLKNVPDFGVLFFRYQLLRTLLEQMTILLGTSLAAVGRIREVNIFSGIFNLLSLVVMYLLFSRGFSPEWYYWIILVFMVLFPGILKVCYCARYCGLLPSRFFREVLLPASVAILVPVLLGSLLGNLTAGDLVPFLCTVVVSTLFLLAWTLRFFDADERAVLVGLCRRIVLFLRRERG